MREREGVPLQAVTVADSQAAQELLWAHAPGLLVAVRSIVFDESEAQDLVQTTFEIALRKLNSVRDSTAIRSWLYVILTREAFRSARRFRRFLSLDRMVAEELPLDHSDPTERLAVESALRGVPKRMRAAVVLRHMVGLSVAECAEAMRVSENTVKTLLRLGLARLRKELGNV